MWGRQSYRLSDFDFEANAKDGIAIDWPIRYADIAPWYDHVEKFAGIAGSREGMPQLPDGAVPARRCRSTAARNWSPAGSRSCSAAGAASSRAARRTSRSRSTARSRCQSRNACWLGCPYGAYFSSQSSTLPAAVKTGRLTLKVWSDRHRGALRQGQEARQRRARDRRASPTRRPTTRRRSSSSAPPRINSTWLLMRSATDIWPGGLGSSSGELGHNLMDHHFRLGAAGDLEGLDDKYYYGRRPTGFYIPRYRNLVRRQARVPARLRLPGWRGPLGLAARGRRAGHRRRVQGRGGATRARGASAARPSARCCPNHANTHHARRDQEGQVGPAGAEDRLRDRRERAPDAQGHDGRHGRDAGAVRREERAARTTTATSPAWASTRWARRAWARDPKNSVLNKHNQVWDAPNVFVTDGSCMTSAACQNPSLTYMALTARAADFAVDELKRRNL